MRSISIAAFVGRLVGLLLLSMWSLAAAAATQDGAPSAASEADSFNRATGAYAQDVERLGRSRGFTIREKAVSLEQLQRALAPAAQGGSGYPPGSAVLFYRHDDSGTGGKLSMWLVTADGIVASAERPLTAPELSDAIEAVRRTFRVDSLQRSRAPTRVAVRQGQASQRPAAADPGALGRLSDLLLPPPIALKLKTVRHLIVVPTGEIGIVPFAALTPSAWNAPLVDTSSVSIAAQLQQAVEPQAPWDRVKAFSKPVIIGDPALAPSSEWNVPPLPGAREEAAALAARLRTRAVIGESATKAEVVRQARGGSLLYFATHGVADPTDAVTGSFLMLSGPTFDEGLWMAREIQSERFDAQLAVLSACQTGLGRAHAGGIIGLSRAFQLAGVDRVVMSLWSVNDDATKYVMSRFAAHLETEPPAEALRRAMVDGRHKLKDPALWSAFLLFGTPR